MFKEGKNKVEKINIDKNVESDVFREEVKQIRKKIIDKLKELSIPIRKEAHKKITDLFNIKYDGVQEEYDKKVSALLLELEQVIGDKEFVADIDHFLRLQRMIEGSDAFTEGIMEEEEREKKRLERFEDMD